MSKKLNECTILGKRKIDKIEEPKKNVEFEKVILKTNKNVASSSIIKIIPHKKVLAFPVRSEPIKTNNLLKSFSLQPQVTVQSNNVTSVAQREECEEFRESVENDHDPALETSEFIRIKKELSSKITNKQEDRTTAKTFEICETHSDSCCPCCRNKLDLILQQQSEILSFLRKPEDLPEKKLDLLPPMPFDDLNDFLDFDESLETHESVQDQFNYVLRKRLVSTEQKSVLNIMSSLLTNELCRKISWIGFKNTYAFSNTNSVSMIIEVLQDHHNCDMDILRNRIADWLRRCGDRINLELKRKKRKEEEELAQKFYGN